VKPSSHRIEVCDWTNAVKKQVANRDLWEPLVELVLDRSDVTFRWVKGHSAIR
jgi:ribonuclease HI